MWRDIERRAEGYGFFAKTPVPYPLSEFDLANKLAILGLKEGWGIDYVRLTYKRWFQEGKEPATEPNISEICSELKLDKDKVKTQSQIKFMDLPEDDPKKRCPDISLAKRILNWNPKISLNEGLDKTISWYRKIV